MLTAWKNIQDASADSYYVFERCTNNLHETQQRLLIDILTRNHSCNYGKKFNFHNIKTATDYQSQVPIVHYEDISKNIDEQTHGHNTLCSEPVLFYEETSGSSAGRKLLPYTQASLYALQQAVNPWLFDLIKQQPNVASGLSYWSISPAGRAPTTTTDGTPIGAPSDLAFLTESMQAAFVELLAVPPQVGLLTNIEEWRYHTVFALIADPGLSLISVWNPGFLILLIDSIPGFTQRLLRDLSCTDNESSLDSTFLQSLKNRCNKPDMLTRLKAATSNGSIDTSKLWPSLNTISCWTHGTARQSLPALNHYFPSQFIQPKGLLATEAVISIPFSASPFPVLAARSAFFEFIDSEGKIWLAHELDTNSSYEVIVTTYGGLYRYAMGDIVKVRGHHNQLPTLEFTGRSGITSDLCGEKLNDAFVANCLQHVAGFSMLAPCHQSTSHANYNLYVDKNIVSKHDAQSVCRQIEQQLLTNPQYKYARHLGQLKPLSLVRINSPDVRYVAYCHSQGQQLGDIKPIALCTNKGLIEYLQNDSTDPACGTTI